MSLIWQGRQSLGGAESESSGNPAGPIVVEIMKVLVTGTAGLIGRWVYWRLKKEGYDPIGLDIRPSPSGIEHVRCDLRRAGDLMNAVQKIQPDAVVHLAARTDLDETRSLSGYAANIDGIHHLLNAVEATPSCRRFICASSQLVCRVGYVPSAWDDYCPDSLYGESKVLTEKIVREREGGGVLWTLVRPTTVWGPNMSSHYLRLLKFIEQRRYFHVGKRPLWKSYSYAGNIAYQIFRMLIAPEASVREKTFYLADYTPISLREYCNRLQQELGAPIIPELPEWAAYGLAKLGDVANTCGIRFPFTSFRLRNILTEYQFDLTETAEICGPLPYSFEQGVRETVMWYREQMSHSHPERVLSSNG